MHPKVAPQDEKVLDPLVSGVATATVRQLDQPVQTPLATVEQLLVEAAIQRPESDALIGSFGSLSYADLLIRAQNIAVALRFKGIVPGQLVGVAMDQSPVTITAIAGILLAGGAYVPLGRDLLQDAQALQRIRASGMTLILCDGSYGTGSCTLWSEFGTVLDASRMEQETMPSSLQTRMPETSLDATAAVLFRRVAGEDTRGVMVPHRAIARLVSARQLLAPQAHETFLLHPATSTRASLLELWGSLLNGVTLALAPDTHLDRGPARAEQLAHSIRQFGVSTLCLPVAALHDLIETAPKCFLRLNTLIIEQDGTQSTLSPQRLQWLAATYPQLHIVHTYGTVETSGYATSFVVPENYVAQASVPIGQPIDGMEAVVLDRELFPAREGEMGELAFAGDGVVTGYFKDPDATAQRFLRRAATENTLDSLLFRSGARARRRTDGLLELHGRAANAGLASGLGVQVVATGSFGKADIEAMLMGQQKVRDAAIVAQEDGQHIALIALDAQHEETHADAKASIEASMRSTLPPAAMPSSFQYVESITRDAQGNVASAPLAVKPEHGPTLLASVAVVNEKQEKREILEQVRAIWLRLLQRVSIGYDEDFFAAGGTQVQMIRMHVELNRRFPGAITMANLSVLTTIRRIYEHLLSLQKQSRSTHDDSPTLAQRGA